MTSSLVAEPRPGPLGIYARPGTGSPFTVLPNPWLLNGVSNEPIPQALLVVRVQGDGWAEVLLPERPNGSEGWIRPGSARFLTDVFRVVVSLHRRTITVLRWGRPIYSGPAAVGAPTTPTPVGLYYVRVLLHTTDPNSPYGPFAYGLSAHSDALTAFDGGDAEIGIHGNNDAVALGHDVTHGCVRIDNAEISKLSTLLPLGTPVQIVA